MSDLKCQECGHDADAHDADPDGVGDCIIGWTKRSPRNKCDCTNTSEQAEISALRAENEQLKSQLSAPLDRGLTRGELNRLITNLFVKWEQPDPELGWLDENEQADRLKGANDLRDAILSTPPVVREEKE